MNTKFLIRGTCIDSILDKLNRGKYNDLKLRYDKSREEKETIINESEGVSVITKRGRKVIVAAKGHQMYVSFVSRGKYKNAPCMWCRTSIQDNPIGLPVGNMEMIVVDNHTRLICYIEDLYCTFECLYASFQMFYSRKDCYISSEEMILHLFDMIHPGEILEPADDWRVLKSNNGWMSTEQFKEGTHRFVDTGKIILVPIKRIYELTQ